MNCKAKGTGAKHRPSGSLRRAATESAALLLIGPGLGGDFTADGIKFCPDAVSHGLGNGGIEGLRLVEVLAQDPEAP